ncbi:MAG: ATP-binding cassette domain-containing protein [Lacisediminihabitans sp.]
MSIHYRSNGVPSEYVAVRGVTLQLARGEIVWLVGESGSGKSTFAMTVAGLAGSGGAGSAIPEISGGSLSVLGTELRGVSKRRRDRLTVDVGYLAQDGAERLNPQFTVAENVAEPIYQRDRRFPTREAGAAVATLVDAVRLPLAVMHRLPYELSSGQRQRVALARALILEPQLLVADEPTRGIDVIVSSGVLDVIAELQVERQLAALVVSSSLSAVSQVAGRVAVMQRGVIVGLGTIPELFDAPQHPYLKGLAQSYSLEHPKEEDRAG